MDCSGAGVGGVRAGEIARGGERRRGDDRGGKGREGRACVSGDVTGSRTGIVWEGNRLFVPFIRGFLFVLR